jgi:hypothetical protein
MKHRTWVWFLAAAAAVTASTTAVAERLPESANSPGTASLSTETVSAEAAKAELAAAVANLEQFLHAGAEWKAAGWKRYLGWNDLTSLLSAEGPPPLDVVTAIQAKLASNEKGLELPEFISVRSALSNYAAAANSSLTATAATAAQVQGPGGYPNFYGFASQRLAAAGFEGYLDRTTPVRDNILGTEVHGVARLTGYTSLVLHENPHMASFSVALRGTAVSNTVGFNRGVTIRSTGLTQLYGQKPMGMTAQGLFGYPPRATGNTSTNIWDICANCGLVEKIAWRRAAQQKPQAEAIASQRAAGRLAAQMEAEAQPTIAQQNYRYYNEFVNPLQERGQFPEFLAFSSRPDRIQVQMLKGGPQHHGAPDAPPGFQAPHDLGVNAHESSIVNYGQGLLGGLNSPTCGWKG